MTYTIVARDAAAGEIGIATQSHYFALGNIVPWLQPSVGAVATQSFVEPRYGPAGLARMAEGADARTALSALLDEDPGQARRQVAMLPTSGPGAAHTGEQCVQPAGDLVDDDHIVMGNMLASRTVWPAMSAAFTATDGDLATRMLAALDAAEAEGGDARGRQAAALKVVRLVDIGEPWSDTVVDLRVDDDDEPLVELRRLLDLQFAYRDIAAVLFDPELLTSGAVVSAAKVDEAEARLSAAAEILGDNVEAVMWRAVLRAMHGRDGVAADVDQIFIARPQLRSFITALEQAGVIDGATLQTLLTAPPTPSKEGEP